MCKSGREIFKGAGLSKMTNTKVIKYGKITENIAYEIVETNSYIDKERLEHLCILSFVTEKDNQFIYNRKKKFFDKIFKIYLTNLS